ncbi:ABC-type metal ion transport system, permease component [Longilinea arvoryzae]|uniref:ABC-type metal ion transport system, permease component n=1 Tax=Longilinea arvoryzae TaxID=360412 RepID=A0A0S7B7F5_9CHLR|nr:methionine ABC transporter permease [Longilinea arvoryzae]GAP13324.1 ABC-type metal ion transport system, permease component [Longilinea arvoryzae]
MDWSIWLPNLWTGTLDTLYMVGVATLFTVALGLPLGVLMVTTDRQGLTPNTPLNLVLGAMINAARSLPFIILLVVVIPLTRLLVGTSIGATAAIVPLSLAAIPFFARVAESALREVDRGLVEAAQAMGCSPWQIILKVLIPEALPSLVLGVALTIISLIGYSAMAGAIGGGGLGDLAIRYGYQRFETTVMIVTVVLLIVLVQGIQALGNRLASRLSHR